MNRALSWSLCLLIVAGLALGISANARRAKERSRVLDRSTGLGERLSRLRLENKALQGEAPDAREIERLKAAKSEVDSLTAEIEALREARKGPSPNTTYNRTLASEWSYAGRATPDNSFESILWAASHGNVEQLSGLIGLAGTPLKTAEELFNNLPPATRQEYANAQKMVATLLAASFPQDAVAARPVEERTSASDAYLSVQVEHSDGKPRTNLYHLRKEADGWHLLIPEGVMDDFEKTLTSDSASLPAAHS